MAILDKGMWYPNKNVDEIPQADGFHHPIIIEAGRYHLYISLACPFAHRPYLVISYLGLEEAISVSSVAAERGADSWLFDAEHPNKINNAQGLVELYQTANPIYSGSVTVPVLWDKQQETIVGNDSSSIAMDLATQWLPFASNPVELVPDSLTASITSLNNWLHQHVNRQVYHLGFAPDQVAYDTANEVLFNALKQLNIKLGTSRYLHGETITLSDLFLMPTLVRFEAIYELHFKANKQSLQSFEHLYKYMQDLVSIPRIRKTIDINHMKRHYYTSHKHINPTGIIPAGPTLAWLTKEVSN